MNFYAIGAFSIIPVNAVLWFFILAGRKRDTIVRSYLKWSLSVAVWALGYGMTLSGMLSPEVTLVWNRLCHAFAAFIPVFFLELVMSLIQKDPMKSKSMMAVYAGGLGLFGLAWSEYLVRGLWQIPGAGYQPLAGPAYWIFGVFFWLVVCEGLFLLARKMKYLFGQERQQVKIFMIGSAIGYLGGSTLFIQAFGLNVLPVGVFFISSYVLFTGYAIYKYGFMDVELIIRRATVFAGLFVFVYGVVAVSTVIGQKYFETLLGWPVWTAMIPSILIITLALRPLENLLINVTEKYLFQKEYDYRDLMRLFTAEVLTIFDYDRITRNTADALNNIIKLESCAVVIRPENSAVYKMAAAIGIKDASVEYTPDNALIQRLARTQTSLQNDTEAQRATDSVAIRAEMKRLGSELCVPIIFRKELMGFISLGNKKSGDVYNQEDIDVLMSLARTEAIAISNARLFRQLAETQAEAAQSEKMAVIGTLAAGINHEICNPLGIVRGQCEMFLLNYRDGIYGQLPDKEVLEQAVTIFGKIIKETDRATSITKRLSTFAKPNKHFQVTEVDVARELSEVIAILGHELRLENVDIRVDLPADFPKILADRKEVQEIIFNIVRNAAQAISGSGKIVIDGRRNGTKAMVMIRDNGHGIPEDKMEKIFHPFFTTKDPGKGTGLGLFIVKQIVERNDGSIAVKSEVGKGTEFTLTFRLAQQNAPGQEAVHA
jgi:two-component system NtrC family sensor kinase